MVRSILYSLISRLAQMAYEEAEMRCCICKRIQDDNGTAIGGVGFCDHCAHKIKVNNRNVYILSLLMQAKVYAPVRLQEEIEKVIA